MNRVEDRNPNGDNAVRPLTQKEQTIREAKKILRSQLLPHLGESEADEFKKAFFTGYMVNRLISANLGRTTEDNRDYYGKKRLDMAGVLICNVFRQAFRNTIKEMQEKLKKDINSRRDYTERLKSLNYYINADSISKALRTALATGNWGKDKDNNVLKTGVS